MTNGSTPAPSQPPTTCLPPLPTLIPGVPPPPDPFSLLPALPPLPTLPTLTPTPTSTPAPASAYYNSAIYKPNIQAQPATAPTKFLQQTVGQNIYKPMTDYSQIAPGNHTPPSIKGMPYGEYSY